MKMKRHSNEHDFGKDFGRAIAKKLLVRLAVGKKNLRYRWPCLSSVNMWVSEGASVPVKKSLSSLHSEYALPLRNKAYNNSGSLQEPQKNPTASSKVNIRGAIGVQANIQGLELKE